MGPSVLTGIRSACWGPGPGAGPTIILHTDFQGLLFCLLEMVEHMTCKDRQSCCNQKCSVWTNREHQRATSYEEAFDCSILNTVWALSRFSQILFCFQISIAASYTGVLFLLNDISSLRSMMKGPSLARTGSYLRPSRRLHATILMWRDAQMRCSKLWRKKFKSDKPWRCFAGLALGFQEGIMMVVKWHGNQHHCRRCLSPMIGEGLTWSICSNNSDSVGSRSINSIGCRVDDAVGPYQGRSSGRGWRIPLFSCSSCVACVACACTK